MAEKAWEKTKYTGIWKKRTARGTQIWIMYDAPRVWREGKPRRNQKQELVPSGKIRDAVALREQRRQEVKQGHHGGKSQAYFGELVEDYLINALPDISPRTRDQYRLYASHPLKALGDRKVSEITPEDIEGLHNDLLKQHAPAYVQQIMSRFKAIMARGVARDYVIRNPFDKVNIKTKRQRPKHSPMDQDETRHFLAHIRDRGTPHDIPWYVMFLMAIDCGLRLGELLAVKWEYVLWDEMRYSVMEQLLRPVKRQPGDLAPQSRSEFGAPKDNSSGQVAMSTELVSALRKHQKEEQLRRGLTGLPTKGLIFCKEDGSPVYDRTVGRVFKECLQGAEISDRRLHDLRHTCASLLISEGASVVQVQGQLRHSDPSITLKVYAHLFPKDLRSAASGLSLAITG